MAEYINGINLDILKWARERSGYTVETIANAVNKDVSIVNDWESGERALTYVQLETLADKYKRPIAIFFFPDPPENLKNRTLPSILSKDSWKDKAEFSNISSGNLRQYLRQNWIAFCSHCEAIALRWSAGVSSNGFL